MGEALIRVKDLCKIYNPGENEVRALDHINLEIDKGEFVAIIGQSGSGKSTFMNMLVLSSTYDDPSRTTPSTGIFSPGRTETRSPTCNAEIGTSSS